jgi:hypothetical protein
MLHLAPPSGVWRGESETSLARTLAMEGRKGGGGETPLSQPPVEVGIDFGRGATSARMAMRLRCLMLPLKRSIDFLVRRRHKIFS